jgi:hypothetical protein
MADEKPTISVMVDLTNAAFTNANRILKISTPGGSDEGLRALNAAFGSMKILMEHSNLLPPEDFKRVFGYERKDQP